MSADYEKIAGFFEDLDMYLHRLKVLEEWVPLLPELEMALTNVFTSVLVLCAISAKYIKMKRIGKYVPTCLHVDGDEHQELACMLT